MARNSGVGAHVRIVGRQTFRVIVGGGRGRPFGRVNQGPLQLVGNHAQCIAAHLRQRVNAGLDAHVVRRGDELPIGDQPHLVGMGNNPLGIGSGQVVAQQEHARPQPGGIGELASRILRAQFDWVHALPELESPLRALGQQAPVIGGADRINVIKVRAGIELLYR